ncbi:MAG: four helix bundle protein [bacterium]|nr:four helix bundle protein [bacterium]
MSIAKREARESKYWLELITDSKLAKRDNDLIREASELVSILPSIVKTSQRNTEHRARGN